MESARTDELLHLTARPAGGSGIVKRGSRRELKAKNDALKISLREMEHSLRSYRNSFSYLLNFSRKKWTSLVKDPARFAEMKESLEKDAEMFDNITTSLSDLETKTKPIVKAKKPTIMQQNLQLLLNQGLIH